jgi:Flp pilus assembly pilin Flp
MSRIVRRLRQYETGAALVEYALIIAGVALIGAAAVWIFGNRVTGMLTTAAAHLPGGQTDTNTPNLRGRINETPPNANGFEEGNPATGIGVDIDASREASRQPRLDENIGANGSLSSLVIETKNR